MFDNYVIQIKLRCSLPMKTLSGIYASGLVKLTDNMDENCISGKLSVQEPCEWRVFSYLWIILLYFSLEAVLIPAVFELGQVVLNINLVKNLTAVT